MKIQRLENRGTSSEIREIEDQNWSGDAYRKIQKKRVASIGKSITLHLGRGIRTRRIEDIPEPRPRRSTKGMTRITNRGTSSRKSRNLGN